MNLLYQASERHGYADKKIQRYAELRIKDNFTLNERMEMLTVHRETLNEQIQVLQKHMAK